ncbi:uncharacterized protein LOC132622922 [Lycium barbarum]|uniref:uncharacterized protein LOC132622922 n=1 Tax=Lycium barbarum TaxID=112863 RepID=UPI00293E3593|nr:uncharacterized protein LOC132622922 [Lycium barbarum]
MPPFMDSQDSNNEAFIEVTDLSTGPSMKLLKKQSLGSEKQISVDPISLKESNELAIPYPKSPPLAIPDDKFLSFSLPNSTTSSPDFSKKKYRKNQINQLPSPLSSTNHLARQHSVALTNLEQLREIHLRRSKSCGEGRASAPPEEFDIWFTPNSTLKHVPAAEDSNKFNQSNLFDEPETSSRNGEIYNNKMLEGQNQDEEKFKCGALCLFIPGFGKGIKHVRSGRRQVSGVSSTDIGPHVVSRTVSLEKFECGSWTSSAAIFNDVGDGASNNMFFDLPLELIRCSNVNDDTFSPVTTGFVFDKEVKGVLKNTTTTDSRKSHESTRHVRFSTSSPTSYPTSPTSCITPTLLKAREDFTTFLEAQSA